MAAADVVKVLFAIVDFVVFWVGVASDGAGLGELVDFFWKNPRIDF